MPQERRRKAADLVVPGREDDAAERKRVLNVLAQRRYRKRKRQHLQELESKVNDASAPDISHDQNETRSPLTNNASPHILKSSGSLHCFANCHEPDVADEIAGQSQTACLLDSQGAPYRLISGSTAAWDSTAAVENPILSPNYTVDLGYNDMPGLVSEGPEPTLSPPLIHDNPTITSQQVPDIELPMFDFEPDCIYLNGGLAGVSWNTLSGIVPQASLRQPRFKTPPLGVNSPSTDTSASSLISARPTEESLPVYSQADPDQENSVQMYRLQHFTFEDSYKLRVLELDLFRGCVTIAKRLNISDTMWSLHETSPFSDPANAHLTYDHLPLNLRPTTAQRTLLHHPVLDLLPWPTARNKLIKVFSQAPDLRPPITRCPTALLDLVYDIEDSAEGVRIWGDDPCDWQNWEIGEKVFKKWWWAFDGEIIRNSNDWRINRGAPILGQVLGEIC